VPSLQSKKVLVVFAVLPAVVFIFLFFFKDVLAARWISARIHRLVPDAQFRAQEVSVGLASIVLRDFSIVQKARGTLPGWELRGDAAVVRVSLWGLIGDPFLAVRQADIRLELVQFGPVIVRGVDLQAQKHPSWPYVGVRVNINAAAYQQKEVKDIVSFVLINKHVVLVERAEAGILGGHMRTTGFIETPRGLSEPGIYSFVVHLKDVQLKDVMAFLGSAKKLDASGVFNGEAVVIWKAGRLHLLRGELNSISGGWLWIKDPSLLGQAVSDPGRQNIVIENLKNYYYDIGKVELRNLGQDIRMDVVLEGEAGRRSLELFWHREGSEKP